MAISCTKNRLSVSDKVLINMDTRQEQSTSQRIGSAAYFCGWLTILPLLEIFDEERCK
jgi:hypothetical protein